MRSASVMPILRVNWLSFHVLCLLSYGNLPPFHLLVFFIDPIVGLSRHLRFVRLEDLDWAAAGA